MKTFLSRRKLLASTMIVAAAPLATKALASEATNTSEASNTNGSDDFKFEVNYTPSEWKSRLSPEEFRILRLGGTEKKKSSPHWKETRQGFYNCKGCDLEIYDSKFKVPLNKGWVFFKHSQTDSVLTKIDYGTSYGGSTNKKAAIEAHCRRCGSHLGHILYVSRQILHCINGASLVFKPVSA